MITRLSLLLVLSVSAMPLAAGLWDADRPGPGSLPSHYDAIAGRFDRFPDRFYERRYELALKSIDALPDENAPVEDVVDSLPDFDDAAVALFRLGRYADAIILLDRKNKRVLDIRDERTATSIEQGTHATANKSVVLFHRWMAGPAAQTTDLEGAARLLRELLKQNAYNSDAHWSLAEIDWLLSNPTWQPDADPLFPNLLGLKDASFHGKLNQAALARNNVAGCIDFLSRRIVNEGGWEDVDVMYAYSLALFLVGEPQESLFAWFRVCELIDAGKTTRVANAPAPKSLKRVLGVHLGDVNEQESARKLYAEMRARADAWVNSRNSYLDAALKEGRHPDTDKTFWAGWNEDDALPRAGEPDPEPDPAMNPAILIGGIGGFAVVLILLIGSIMFLGRRSSAHDLDD
ncbi:MAG: hypothetical protein KDB82_10550 [Planctomycetes bacterium]|nr:hypothetical protein [Planctomycetota bacterium]